MDKPFSMNRAWKTRFGIRGLLAGFTGVGLVLLLATEAWAPQYTGGPSVRVTPNVQVEFKWQTDVAWLGMVEVFDNPAGTGLPVVVQPAEDAAGTPIKATTQDVIVPVAQPFAPDTGYFFRVTATDPGDTTSSIVIPPAGSPLPPFFTGTQAITNVFVDASVDSAAISWEANVIGYGSVMYGTTALNQGPVEDAFNITNHAIQLTGLSAGTTYQFRVCNKHAIDRDCLASATGQFTTQQPVAVELTQPQAQPRVIQRNDVSILSVKTLHQGQPMAGVVVSFAIDPSSSGRGTFGGSGSAVATTDANGVASVQITGTTSGLVHVNVTSTQALNALTMPVVVR